MENDLIPYRVIMIVAIVGGIISIYLTELPYIGGIFSIIVTLLALVYGTNTIRHINTSTLVNGQPPIDYMLTACGLISSITGMTFSILLNQKFLFPIFSIIIATLMGLIISLISKYILKVKDDILYESYISISISTMLSIIGMSTFIASSYDTNLIYSTVIKNGLLILLMVITIIVKQTSFNTCSGPNEDQYRTLSLTLTYGFLMLIVISIISMFTNPYWYVYTIICSLGCIISIMKFFKYVKHQAASIKWSGLWDMDDKRRM